MHDTEPEQTRSKAGRPRSAQSHQAILEATLTLFAQEGLAGLSIEAIAERAGVGKTTIYRRWSSKEDVIKEALTLWREDLPLPNTGSLRTDLVSIAKEAHALFAHHPFMAKLTTKLIAEIKTNPEIYHAFYDKVVIPQTQKFRQIIQRAQVRGEVREDLDTTFVLSLVFISLVYGPLLASLIDPYAPPVYEPEVAVDALLRGIGR